MPGIVVVIGSDDIEISKQICDKLRHRGSISEWHFTEEGITLSYVGNDPLLNQPTLNDEKSICITFDGEIFNRCNLFSNDPRKKTQLSLTSAELVLLAYEQHGAACLPKLNGGFAFSLWDSQKQILFSARDKLGVKPLYYVQTTDLFIIASEIKGILSCPFIRKEPNEQFISEYLMHGYPNKKKGETFFKGIYELLPATYLVYDQGVINLHTYWKPRHSTLELRHKDYAHAFRELFHDSVEIRLPDHGPVGTFVSGGLDSTIITFVLEDIIQSLNIHHNKSYSHHLFSAIYQEPSEISELTGIMRADDERKAIKEVEAAIQKEINYVYPSVHGRWGDIKKFVYYIEEPIAVFNYYVFWNLLKATEGKVKTVYHGEGAGTLFGGVLKHVIGYYKELWSKRKIIRLIKELIQSIDWIVPPLLFHLRYSMKVDSHKQKMLSQTLSNHVIEKRVNTEGSLEESLHNALEGQVLECLRVNDRAASVFSVDIRYPYLDHRLINFGFSLPANEKYRSGYTKYILRDSMKGVIPEYNRLNRKKAGTPIPFQNWIKDLQEDLLEMFESDAFKKRKYFNHTTIHSLLQKIAHGELHRLEHSYQAFLWRIINIELWFEAFFDDN